VVRLWLLPGILCVIFIGIIHDCSSCLCFLAEVYDFYQ
jgi:hypothetical protein